MDRDPCPTCGRERNMLMSTHSEPLSKEMQFFGKWGLVVITALAIVATLAVFHG